MTTNDDERVQLTPDDWQKSAIHRVFGRWTAANGTPDAETAGSTSPSPSLPAPKCRCRRDSSALTLSGPSAFCSASSVTSGSISPDSVSFCFCQSSRVSCTLSLSSSVVVISKKSSSAASGSLERRLDPNSESSSSSSSTWHSDIRPSSFTSHTSIVRGSLSCRAAAIWTSRAGRTERALLQPRSDGTISAVTIGSTVASMIMTPLPEARIRDAIIFASRRVVPVSARGPHDLKHKLATWQS